MNFSIICSFLTGIRIYIKLAFFNARFFWYAAGPNKSKGSDLEQIRCKGQPKTAAHAEHPSKLIPEMGSASSDPAHQPIRLNSLETRSGSTRLFRPSRNIKIEVIFI